MTLLKNFTRGLKVSAKKNTENEINLDKAKINAENAGKSAKKATEDAKIMIRDLYDGISEQVQQKFNASDVAHTRAEDLLRRASNLATALTTSNKSLQKR